MNANAVHTGDVFVRYGFPFIDANSGGNIYGMIDAINMLIRSVNDSCKIIPGHGAVAQKKDLISYRDMLDTVESRVRHGIEHNLSIEEIKQQNPLKNMNFQVDYYFSLEMVYEMVKKKMNK
jgi:glyoxylase-like metal-dependent hydrolase (beta-lactamase superfamily II)